MMHMLDQCNIVFDSLENGTLVVDEECTVWAWNKWLEINTGIASEVIIGKNLQEFYPELDYKGFQRKIRTTLRLNTPTFYDASLSNRFITIPRNKITTSLLKSMQLQATIAPYISELNRVMVAIYDISDLHELKMTLQQRMDEIARLNIELKQDKQIIDANLMILKADCFCMIVDATEAFQHFSGYSKEELLERPISAFHVADNSSMEYQQMREILLQKKKWSGEVEVERKNGKVVWMDTVISPYLDENDEVVSYTVIYHDITDKKRIELLSVTDPLTKLFNRQKFNEVFEMMLMRRHWKEGNTFALVIADIDFFKTINDTYGHQAGDAVLIQVGEILTKTMRTGDILARWGGEEFVILLPDVNKDKACFVAEKFRRAIDDAAFPGSGKVSASFGITLYAEGDTDETMLYRSDIALYRAKKNGRNRVELA